MAKNSLRRVAEGVNQQAVRAPQQGNTSSVAVESRPCPSTSRSEGGGLGYDQKRQCEGTRFDPRGLAKSMNSFVGKLYA